MTGAEPRAAGNHGQDFHAANETRYDRVVEFEHVLRRLWDSFEDDAIVADAAAGVFLDPGKLHATDFHGAHLSVTGPLNVARPVQGHLPIVHAGTSPRSRLFAAQSADLALVAVNGLEHAVAIREELRVARVRVGPRRSHPQGDRARAADRGGDPGARAVHRRRAQRARADRRGLARRPAGGVPGEPVARPAHRRSWGSTCRSSRPTGPSRRRSSRASRAAGQELVEIVAERTGRSPSGERPPTLRHLVVAASVNASMVVGTAVEIAAEFEAWGEAGAVDGFNVLSAVQPAQFDAFALGVVPELQRRGVFPTEYEGETLRDHLGLGRPDNVHVTRDDAWLRPVTGRDGVGLRRG